MDKIEVVGCMRFIFCMRFKFGGFEIGGKLFVFDLKRLRFLRRKDSKLIKFEFVELFLILWMKLIYKINKMVGGRVVL